MAGESAGVDLGGAVALLAAGVVAAPVFRRLGLGSVLGYLIAGVAIGPFGLKVFDDPESILHVAELGVVLFLFIIGLEMRPAKLWSMRKDIFGVGAAQVATCGILLSAVAMAAGLPPNAAIIGAFGFVLSSTAVIMKMLDDSGETATAEGQRAVSILLFEDLMIVPLLAMVAVMASISGAAAMDAGAVWRAVALGLGAIALLVAAGRWLLNPFFALLARAGAREVMTAAALLVVLGAALFMQTGGLSMAMGAFLAGVLLSESTFRHQLEADIEPFRGILLGLFFISVGMSLNLAVVVASWPLILGGVAVFMAVKAAAIYAVARATRTHHRDALRRATLFAQGGEFAFVLYAAASAAGVIEANANASLTAIVILSMALTPLLALAVERLLPKAAESMEGVEVADGLSGQVLIIGFGRFAQVASQALLARGMDIAIIDNDVEMIRAAGNFGFRVYYGDGQRLDVLRASGAGEARAILVCVDKQEAADRIVLLCKAEFPQAKLFVRAFDRGHAMRLIQAGVDYQLREVFESSLAFGREVLTQFGVDPATADETIEEVRARDAERLALQLVGGIQAGAGLMRGNVVTPQPEPFTQPRREGKALNPEAADAIGAES